MLTRLVTSIRLRGPHAANRRVPLAVALAAGTALVAIAAGVSAGGAAMLPQPTPAQSPSHRDYGAAGWASGTIGWASAVEASDTGASASQVSTAAPWRCAEGDEPRVTPPDVTAPPAPFRGIVSVDSDYDPDSGTETIVVGYHNTRDRTNAEFRVEGISTGGPISVRADARGLLIERGGGAFSFADSCSLEPAERYQHFTVSGAGNDPVGRGYYARLFVPWGGAPRIDGIRLDSDEDSPGFANTEPYTFATSNGLGGALFDIGTHANGIHIVAADQVGAYVITRYGDEAPPEDFGLYGDNRSWSINDDVFLLGTDGELLAFGIWPYEPAWAPPEITVMSMLTGEVVACGNSWHWVGLLLISPPDEGLLVSDITLPPSGWLNPPDSCPRGIGADLLEYLASQPVPDPPAAVRAPRPVSLPSTPAPAAPFHGIVRSFTRYNPANYGHDHIVQYYDSRSGEVTEIAFDDIGTGRFSRGFEKRLAVAPDGVVVGRRGSVLLMIPWGAAPELVYAQLQVPQPAHADPSLVLGDGVDDPNNPYTTACETASLEVRGETLQAWLREADYGDEWNRLRLLQLAHGDLQARYLLAAPVETLGGEVEVSTVCHDYLVFEAEYDTPRLRGTDADVLVLSYQYVGRDAFFGVPGTDLTYVVSLDTGAVLACGIEPRYSEMVFVTDDPPDEPERPSVLPASGWLDPRPCVDAPDVGMEDCTSMFWRRGDQRTCARELDFRTIGENADGISTTPVTITVGAELDRFE